MAKKTPRRKAPKQTVADWRARAARELKGGAVDGLIWRTPEGIPVKPLYTAADLEGIEAVATLPGFPPYLRGPRATMYAGRPWTIRQYAGFSTA
ncbi:MAG TPA: methylmalonyl-CoA mutase family protein, partial [Rhodospirillales bacterium]